MSKHLMICKAVKNNIRTLFAAYFISIHHFFNGTVIYNDNKETNIYYKLLKKCTMKTLYVIVAVIFAIILLPFYSFGAVPHVGVYTGAELIYVYGLAAFITALICYRELLFPRYYDNYSNTEYNRLPFQAFNLLFVSLFFFIGYHFLIVHKNLYVGYENLSDEACIKKAFLSDGLFSVMQIIIASSLVVNVIYIATHVRDYYLSGE